MALAAVDAAAFFSGAIPGVGIEQIAVPERPCAALVGADGVNFTGLAAIDKFEKNAVVDRPLLNDGDAGAYAKEILSRQFIIANLEIIGDKAYFILCNPDISFIRAGAAFSALAALKMQAADIPGGFFSRRLHKKFK